MAVGRRSQVSVRRNTVLAACFFGGALPEAGISAAIVSSLLANFNAIISSGAVEAPRRLTAFESGN
jgi:hypothetical protein